MGRARNEAAVGRRIGHRSTVSMSSPNCGKLLRCRYLVLFVVGSFVVFKALLYSQPQVPSAFANNLNGTTFFQVLLKRTTSSVPNRNNNATNITAVAGNKPSGNRLPKLPPIPVFHWSVGEIFTNSTLHPVNASLPVVYVVTPTYRRLEQLAELTRLAQTLMHVPALHWIVVEDAMAFSGAVRQLLRRVGVNFTHMLGPKPVKFAGGTPPAKKSLPRGVSNRVAALRWVQQNVRDGVLYFADDDNSYDIRLFEEMRRTKKVSMWPVGLVTHLAVSSPVVTEGRVSGFYDGWIASRKFPVDMAGFGVNIAFLLQHPNVTMPFAVGYEEDGFLRSLGITVADIEPRATNCTQVLVWHTKTVANKPPRKFTKKEVDKYSRTNIPQLQNNMW